MGIMVTIETLQHVADAHRHIRADLRQVGGSIGDSEVVESLEKAKFNVLANMSQPLSVKIEEILKDATAIRAGVKRHYDFEESELPPILGDVLTESLKIQHSDLLEEMDLAISTMSRLKAEGSSPEQRVVDESLMDALLDKILRHKSQHMKMEDAVLEMAKIALDARAKRLVGEGVSASTPRHDVEQTVR